MPARSKDSERSRPCVDSLGVSVNVSNPSFADEVVDYAAEVFRQRISDLGDDESGAYIFYVSKLGNNMPLSPQEKALIETIERNYGKDSTFYEVGAGVGFLCLALAALGFHAVAVDTDHRRIVAGQHIRDEVAKKYPQIATRLDVQKVRFGAERPDRFGPEGNRQVAISTNLVNGWTHENGGLVAEELSRFDDCIVDLLMFGIKRDRTDADQVRAMFAGKSSDVFLDLGLKGAGLYCRFSAPA